MRVLITLSPLMYREAVTQSVRQHRPGFEVRIASPEAVEEEVMSFEPHLLVRNDTDGIDHKVLASVPCWVEMLYSDPDDPENGRYCDEPRLRQAPMRSRPGSGRLRGGALDRPTGHSQGISGPADRWVRPIGGVAHNHL